MTEDKKSKPRKILKRLFFAVLVGLLCGILLLSLVILPDQFRTVRAPSSDVWEWSAREDERTGRPSIAGKDSVPSADDVAGKNVSEVSPPVIHPVQRLAEKYRVFPDVSSFPGESREAMELWNRHLTNLVSEVAAIVDASGETTYETAEQKWGKIQSEYDKMMTAQGREIRPNTSKKVSLDDPVVAVLANCWKLMTHVHLVLATKHEKWEDAANDCRYMVELECGELWGIDRNSVWWEREVYYWRKSGSGGRIALAVRSSQPYWMPVTKILYPSLLHEKGTQTDTPEN